MLQLNNFKLINYFLLLLNSISCSQSDSNLTKQQQQQQSTDETFTNDYLDIQCNLNDEDYLNLKASYDLQTFPSINIICGTNHLYNLTVNLQAKKRKNSLIPPYIYCNSLNKSCKYSTTTANIIKKRLSYFDVITQANKKETADDDDEFIENIDKIDDERNIVCVDSSIAPKDKSSASNNVSKIQKDNNRNGGESMSNNNYLKLKEPISPSPGDRRRLSLDTCESDVKQPYLKCLKCNNYSPYDKITGVSSSSSSNNNNSQDETGSSNNHSSRSNYNNNSDSYSSRAVCFAQKQNLKLRHFDETAKSTSTNSDLLLTPVSAMSTASKLLSYSPSSPVIVLSNLSDACNNKNKFLFNDPTPSSASKVLTELCTSTQTQLNLADKLEQFDVNKSQQQQQHMLFSTSIPLTCNISSSNSLKQMIISDNLSSTTYSNCDFDDYDTKDDMDEDLILQNSVKDVEQQSQENKQMVHFIRSPTDGVCLPIFKNQDCNGANDTNGDSSSSSNFNVS